MPLVSQPKNEVDREGATASQAAGKLVSAGSAAKHAQNHNGLG